MQSVAVKKVKQAIKIREKNDIRKSRMLDYSVPSNEAVDYYLCLAEFQAFMNDNLVT